MVIVKSCTCFVAVGASSAGLCGLPSIVGGILGLLHSLRHLTAVAGSLPHVNTLHLYFKGSYIASALCVHLSHCTDASYMVHVYVTKAGSISFRYMSYWGLFVITAGSVCHFLTSVWCYMRHGQLQQSLATPLLFKATWFLHDMAVSSAPFISTIYFTFVNEGRVCTSKLR